MTGAPLLLGALLFAACLGLSWAATRAVLGYLLRHAILDHPNERSNHSVPTPRGGGWGILAALLPATAVIGWGTGSLAGTALLLFGALLLAAVSWADDRRGLSPMFRLLCQAVAVALGLAALPADASILQGLVPWWLDRLAAAVGWIWFVNLYNFMDGIDGLAGSETAMIGLGIALVAGTFGDHALPAWVGIAAAGSALGFLAWNWHPARIFMGDVGSIPLGYLLGWLLLTLAADGHWIAALLLPAYFLSDATWTLARRLVQGKSVWQAHREHFYQQAVQAGRSHARVVCAVLAADSALILLAVASPMLGWPALLLGGVCIAILIAWQRNGPLSPPSGRSERPPDADERLAQGG